MRGLRIYISTFGIKKLCDTRTPASAEGASSLDSKSGEGMKVYEQEESVGLK